MAPETRLPFDVEAGTGETEARMAVQARLHDGGSAKGCVASGKDDRDSPAAAELSSMLASNKLSPPAEEGNVVAKGMPASAPSDVSAKRRSLVALLGRPGDALPSTSAAGLALNGATHKSAGAQERASAMPMARPVQSRSSSAKASSPLLAAASDGTIAVEEGAESLHNRYTDERGTNEMVWTTHSVGTSDPAPISTSDRGHSEQISASVSDQHSDTFSGNWPIPHQLIHGDLVLKVTTRKVMQRVLRVDLDLGQIFWQSKKNASIPLDSVREVLTGSRARKYREQLSVAPSHEARWISVVYQTPSAYKTLHFIAFSDASFKLWSDALSSFRDESELLLTPNADTASLRQHSWYRQHWSQSHGQGHESLDFEQILSLCRRMGITSSRADLLWRFKEAGGAKSGTLDFQGFQRFVAILKSRNDVVAIFSKWADGRDATVQHDNEAATMSLERFTAFLNIEQGRHDATRELAVFLCRRYSERSEAEAVDFNTFLSFLSSADNSIILDQSCQDVCQATAGSKLRKNAATAEELVAVSTKAHVVQDMTRPLSDYFVSSSHNTYLIGAQLMGDSNVQGYVRALLQGARSVELDCWDGPNGQPQVTHGRTLTTKVSFREVIEAIGRYAFTSSPYPLILSLEVHTEVAQQDAMAGILRSVLGDKLLTEHLQGFNKDITALPSPQELSGKILIKAKNLHLAQSPAPNGTGVHIEAMVERSNTSTTDTTESESDGLFSNARDLVRSVTKRGKSKGKEDAEKAIMSNALASLLVYTVGVKHRGLSKKETYAIEHMFSLSERSALKYVKGSSSGPSREDLIKHNRTHLTRIYPSMNSIARLSYSANYVPSTFWALGCQLVSLNWQTADLGLEMNQALFARNKRCGYVLKPEALREKDAKTLTPASRVSVRLDVTIVSGQQLPQRRDPTAVRGAKSLEDVSDTDPFVSAAVICPEASSTYVRAANSEESLWRSSHDSRREISSSQSRTSQLSKYTIRQKTSVMPRNSFSPVWDETLSFCVDLPSFSGAKASAHVATDHNSLDAVHVKTGGLLDLCFLRFEVRDGSGLPQQASRPSAQRKHSGTEDSLRSSSNTGSSPSRPSLTLAEQSSFESKDRDGSQSNDAYNAPILGTYMVSLGAMQQGYHHVPLLDAQLNPHVFSTLFVRTRTTLVDEA